MHLGRRDKWHNATDMMMKEGNNILANFSSRCLYDPVTITTERLPLSPNSTTTFIHLEHEQQIQQERRPSQYIFLYPSIFLFRGNYLMPFASRPATARLHAETRPGFCLSSFFSIPL